MDKFIQRHKDKIAGVISCYDRVVLTGTLPELCHASAMAGFLRYKGIRIFDYQKWAEPLREDIRIHAEAVAKDAGLKVDFICSQKDFRKEERIKEIIVERGDHTGLVHIFSAMESCPSYRPWHDKKSGKTFLRMMIKIGQHLPDVAGRCSDFNLSPQLHHIRPRKYRISSGCCSTFFSF